MSRVTLKSQAIVIAQLEAQVAELTTQVGVLMNQLEAANQRAKSLSNERDDLIVENQRLVESTIAAHERCDVLESMVAKPSAPVQAPSKAAHKPEPVSAEVESAPIVEVSGFDIAMYRKFKALSREQRLAIIEFARPHFGHVGVHNIVEVRAAWHDEQASVA